jgi:hypothetical protein
MSDRILDRYASSRSDSANTASPTESEGTDDLGAFGFLRGARERATMIELRRKDGSIRAISFGWLEHADFDPSGTITLKVHGQTIRIKGRNLNLECRPEVRLFSAICRHRVPWIQEADEPMRMEAGKRTVVIESIEW